MEENLQPRVDLTDFASRVQALRQQISTVIVGQSDAVELVLTAMLADGHVLIEGVPGVAKTLLARVVSHLVDARFSRLQFTPDLMPSDVLGTMVLNMQTARFDFHAGPIFADIVLVDEINRAPAKTQAALFEVMEERQATIDGVSHPMSRMFTVMATQNPVEQEGTYRLPEAQLDRFMMKISVPYPSLAEEVEILMRHQQNTALMQLTTLRPVLTIDDLLSCRSLLSRVVVEDSLVQYIALVVQQTRVSPLVYLGASPRAAVALLRASKAHALLQGRDFVIPDDIQRVSHAVLSHRLLLTAEAEMGGYTTASVLSQIMQQIQVPQ